MSIQPHRGILNIPNATLRVGKLAVDSTAGFDTFINVVERNTTLLEDVTEYTGTKQWDLKLPNIWVATFEIQGISSFNFQNTSVGTAANGYTLLFSGTTLTLKYGVETDVTLATATIPNLDSVYGKVYVTFEKQYFTVTIDGTRVLAYKDTVTRTAPQGGEFINFFDTSGTFKNLKIVAGNWISDGTSNVVLMGGNLGIGTDTPEDTLHVNGGIRFAGHIIPTTNATFDIGSAEKKIRDMYVDTNSLWIGDTTKIAFSGGKLKFKRRKVNKVPRMVKDLAIEHGRADEADVETHAIAFAHAVDSTITEVADLKLEHWRDYTKTFDSTKAISDIFANNVEDYEAVTASEAFVEVGSDIYSAHNISIGKTTAPTSKLDVAGTVTATAAIFSGDVAVNTNTLFVDSSANSVGLGTVTPSANLHVTGNVYVSSNLEVGTANLFVDTVNSRVGIGTTAPESLLHLSASTASADITDPIKIKIHNRRGAGDWSITQPWGLLEFDTDDNGTAGTGPVAGIGCRFEGTSGGDSSICFYTDNIVNDDNVLGAANERMCINSDGNVGIGTNAPSNALHIRNAIPAVLLDDTDDDTKVRLTGGTGGDLYIDSNYGGSGSTGDIIFREASSEKMRITGAGNVGIGTNVPATALEVNGDIGIGRVAGGYTFREVVGGGVRATIKSNATNDLILSTGGDSEALRILTNGNVGIGKSDPTSLLHIYNEDTTAAGSTILSTIHGVFSGSDATGGNINNRGLLINLDSSATGGTTTSPQEHRLYGVDVDIDVTGDSDMITGGRFNINSDLAANGDDRTTHMYALDAMTRNNGSAPNSTMASLNARTLKASASGGLTDNMLGVRSEVEINAGSCTNVYGAQCIIDANHGSITNSYLYHGNYPTQGADTATITNKYGLYIAGADKNYITGNVGIGTNNPVGVNGGQRLEGSSSTGFEYIATRDDTAAVADDFVGAYLFKNTDTNGTEPHYAGMSSKMTGTNGPMDLRFHTNRDQYEGDTPQMIINSAGYVGIGTTDPKSIFHVGVGDADLRIGAVDYTGTSANTTTYGLERSRNQILFSTWRDAQTNKIGAKICGINKQTYSSPSLRHLIQSTDLAFYTVPPDSSDYDDTVERLRITDTGNVGIGTQSPDYKLEVNGSFSASGPTTGANHGSSSTLYLLDTCFFKEWEYINTVAPTAKVTFNTSTEIPDGAKAVLAEVYLGRDSLTTGDHQVHVLGKNHTGGQTAWRSGAGQPSTAFSADVDTRQTVDLLMPGESDGFTHHYGKWHSSVIIPLENNKIYYSNAGNSSSTGWVYVRIRGYYI